MAGELAWRCNPATDIRAWPVAVVQVTQDEASWSAL